MGLAVDGKHVPVEEVSNNSERGIIYVATGARYVKEAEVSAQSVRRWMPEMPTTIWTDDPARVRQSLFTEIRKIEKPSFSFLDRFDPFCGTPYAKTLYLDTDTLLLGSVHEVFAILDRFDFACAHGPVRGTDSPELLAACPAAFVEPNAGVFAYNRNAETIRLFQLWAERYQQQLREFSHRKNDQPSLRRLLWESSIRFVTLPPEYNLRTPFPVFSGRMPVKILHGREPALSRAAKKINLHSQSIRIYDFSKKTLSDRIRRLVTGRRKIKS